MPTLSVIVITKNEEDNIGRCLQSVQWADELIVVDSGSTDQTVAIAKSYGARVYHQDWLGFGAQKNKALEKATSDWVLSLDADEFLLEKDGNALQQWLSKPHQASAVSLLRIGYFRGKKIRYSYGPKERHVRLFRRGSATFDNAIIHERLITEGQIQAVNLCIQHETIQSISEVLAKMQTYTTLGAKKRHESGKKATLGTLILKPLIGFFKVYCIRRGFLDGKYGFIIACCHSHSIFYRQLKLLERQKKL